MCSSSTTSNWCERASGGSSRLSPTSSSCNARLGHRVTCVDADESKVDDLRSGLVSIAEPGLTEIVIAAPGRDEPVEIGGVRFRFEEEP